MVFMGWLRSWWRLEVVLLRICTIAHGEAADCRSWRDMEIGQVRVDWAYRLVVRMREGGGRGGAGGGCGPMASRSERESRPN